MRVAGLPFGGLLPNDVLLLSVVPFQFAAVLVPFCCFTLRRCLGPTDDDAISAAWSARFTTTRAAPPSDRALYGPSRSVTGRGARCPEVILPLLWPVFRADEPTGRRVWSPVDMCRVRVGAKM